MKAKQLLMKAKELREFLNGIPDDAKIFLKCDHGENIESGDLVVISRSEIEGNDYDAMIFEYDDWKEYYEECLVNNYPVNGKITAVLIQS